MDHDKIENKEKKEVKVKLLEIQETAFFIDSPLLRGIDDTASRGNFKVRVGFHLPEKDKGNIFELKTIVRYYHLLEKKSKKEEKNTNIHPIKIKVLELVTSNFFEFDDLGKYLTFKNDTIADNSSIIPFLLNVAVGAMRGILVIKTAGTCLSNHPLPIMNMDVFTKSSDDDEDG